MERKIKGKGRKGKGGNEKGVTFSLFGYLSKKGKGNCISHDWELS